MNKVIHIPLFLFLPVFLMLLSCNRALNLKVDKGDFSKSKSEVMTSKYQIKSTDGFFSRIDFELTEGKVDWEITDPKGDAVFKGDVINENGKTFKQLTYPPNFSGWQLTEKLEILPDKNSEMGINNNPDFGYLQFNSGESFRYLYIKFKTYKRRRQIYCYVE